ncbi:hypothetical protein FGO68_gene4522 [Halteria grandinella]|uniref:Transmembrane protein n=1 Tax=Halteria grandinella TaxID=5974 RepID=A0A8J8NSL5_HALGN|nr:hypothetical protein FGO68_gene4522 [Halteria grandinella]
MQQWDLLNKRILQEVNQEEEQATTSNQEPNTNKEAVSVIFYLLFIGIIAGALSMIFYLIKKCFCPDAKCLKSKRGLSKVHAINDQPQTQQIREGSTSVQQISQHQTQLSTIIPFMADDETVHSSNLSMQSCNDARIPTEQRQILQNPRREQNIMKEDNQKVQEHQRNDCQQYQEKNNNNVNDSKQFKRQKPRRKRGIKKLGRNVVFDESARIVQQEDQNENMAQLKKEVEHLQFC